MRRLSMLLAALALVAGACGGASGDASAPSAPADVEPASSPGAGVTAPSEGTLPAALAVTLPTLGGGQFDGGDLAGRDVVLWFWAPW